MLANAACAEYAKPMINHIIYSGVISTSDLITILGIFPSKEHPSILHPSQEASICLCRVCFNLRKKALFFFCLRRSIALFKKLLEYKCCHSLSPPWCYVPNLSTNLERQTRERPLSFQESNRKRTSHRQ